MLLGALASHQLLSLCINIKHLKKKRQIKLKKLKYVSTAFAQSQKLAIKKKKQAYSPSL